jgi:hypothetical protein
VGRHVARGEEPRRQRLEIPRELPLSSPAWQAAAHVLQEMRDRARVTASRDGFGQAAIEHDALTHRARVGLMVSRQARTPDRPECWHLALSEWRDAERRPASPEEFAAWIGCGWPELDAVDTFTLVSGRHAVIACSATGG